MPWLAILFTCEAEGRVIVRRMCFVGSSAVRYGGSFLELFEILSWSSPRIHCRKMDTFVVAGTPNPVVFILIFPIVPNW